MLLFSHFRKVTQLVSGGAGIWTQACVAADAVPPTVVHASWTHSRQSHLLNECVCKSFSSQTFRAPRGAVSKWRQIQKCGIKGKNAIQFLLYLTRKVSQKKEFLIFFIKKLKSLLTNKIVIYLKYTTWQASFVAQMIKNLPAIQETWVWSLGREDPWRREWLPTPVFLPWKLHGHGSLVGYRPWGCKELDMTEWLTYWLDIYVHCEKIPPHVINRYSLPKLYSISKFQ